MLRLFSPCDDSVSAASPLNEYFEDWYAPALLAREEQGGRPVSPATIARRRAAVAWWTKLMRSAAQPSGPPIGEITGRELKEFRERLRSATFRRGKWTVNRYSLSEVTQIRTLQEVQIVIATAGPAAGSLLRAGLLTDPPSIYMPANTAWPKPTWTLDEARLIVAAIPSTKPPHRRIRADGTRPIKLDRKLYTLLAEATVALWFYSGERATTYARLRWADLVEFSPGQWYLTFRAVKTNKATRIAVHPVLLARLERLRGIRSVAGDADRIIPWPVTYTAIDHAHTRWQESAGLTKQRQFPPQAWRRLHATQIAATGFALARTLSQRALGHSSASVTESHYTSTRDAACLMLPDLWDSSQ